MATIQMIVFSVADSKLRKSFRSCVLDFHRVLPYEGKAIRWLRLATKDSAKSTAVNEADPAVGGGKLQSVEVVDPLQGHFSTPNRP